MSRHTNTYASKELTRLTTNWAEHSKDDRAVIIAAIEGPWGSFEVEGSDDKLELLCEMIVRHQPSFVSKLIAIKDAQKDL